MSAANQWVNDPTMYTADFTCETKAIRCAETVSKLHPGCVSVNRAHGYGGKWVYSVTWCTAK